MPSRNERVRSREQSGAWILSLPADLDADVEESLATAVEQGLASKANLLVLDFSSVAFANSAGIGTLVDALRRARERTIRVVLAGVGGQPRLILERIGFLNHIASFSSVEEALGSPP